MDGKGRGMSSDYYRMDLGMSSEYHRIDKEKSPGD